MSAARAFLFGKLPRHGDFVVRGLDAGARQAWDGWLSAAIDRARADLGQGFEAGHDVAPPWRFVCPPGALGPGIKAGALAPSIDAAGRRFFVVVGGEAPPAETEDRIAERMEELIYRAFEEGLDADALADAAQAVLDGFGDAIVGAPREHWWTALVSCDRPPDRLVEAAP